MNNVIVASFEESFNAHILNLHNVTHVLNVATECNVKSRVDLVYAKYSIHDDTNSSMLQILKECMLFLDKLTCENTVIVHCMEGKSRSVCIVLAYMCTRLNWKWDNALAHIHMIRPCIDPFPKYFEETRLFVKNYINNIVFAM